MAGVVVTMSGDDAKLWKAFENVIKQQDRTKKGYDGIGKASDDASRKARENAREQARMDKEKLAVMERGRKLTQSLLTPQEKHNQLLKEANELREKGAITDETFVRRKQQLKSDFDELNKKQAKQNSLIETASGKVAQYTTAAAAAGVAIASIRATWRQVIEEQQKGLDALKKNEDSSRRLVQVSGGNPEVLAAYQRQAASLSSQFGVDIETVERVLFSAISAGFQDAVGDIIAGNQVVSPEAAAGVAGQVPILFQNQIKPLEAVNLTLKAAADSLADFETIARVLPKAAEGGNVIGATPEETFAAISVLTGKFKNAETASDRFSAFTTQAGIDPRFSGKGFIGAYQALAALPEGDRKEFLGKSAELNTAYIAIGSVLDQIIGKTAEFRQENQQFNTGGGLYRANISVTQQNEIMSARRENNIATQRLEQAYRDIKGVEGATADSAVKGVEQQLLENGSVFSRVLNNTIGVGANTARASVLLGSNSQDAAARGAAVTNSFLGTPLVIFDTISRAASVMESASKTQAEASQKMLEASRKQGQQANNRTGEARASAALAAQGS